MGIGRDGAAEREREFTEFATVTTPRLLRTARLLCGDQHLSEDLVQTTLAGLFASWPRVRRTFDTDRYAHAALMNAFLSHKRLARSREVPTDTGDLQVPSLADEFTSAEERLDLLAALRQLNATDRAILVLRFWVGLPVQEVAATVGLTDTALRARSSRAARHVRELLTEVRGNEVREKES